MSAETMYLEPVTCFSWCQYGDGHAGQISARDQSCMTVEHRVETECSPSVEVEEGTWASEYITTYGLGWARRDREARIWVGRGETSTGFEVTVAEARQIAAAILNAADEMEAGARQ